MKNKSNIFKIVLANQDFIYLRDEEDFYEFTDDFLKTIDRINLSSGQLRIARDRVTLNIVNGSLKPKKYPALMLAHPDNNKLPWYFIYEEEVSKLYNLMQSDKEDTQSTKLNSSDRFEHDR